MSLALTDDEVWLARGLFAEGLPLGAIAAHLGCSLYALSPWLYMESPSVVAALWRVEASLSDA